MDFTKKWPDKTGQKMIIEQELVSRYEKLLRSDNLVPCQTSKSEWVRSITEKILELKRIINRDKK